MTIQEIKYYQARYLVLVNQLVRLNRILETNKRAGAKLYMTNPGDPAYQENKNLRNRIFCLKADTYVLFVVVACMKDDQGEYINNAKYGRIE